MAGAPEVETVADTAGAGVNAAGTTPEFKFGEYNTIREFTQAALRVYNQKDKVSLQNLINKDGSSKIGGLDLAVGDLTDAERNRVGAGKSVTYKSGDVTVRFVVGKTGGIDFSLSTITEKGVTLKTNEIRSDTKYKHLAVLTQALRTEADTKKEAEASKEKQLPEIPVSGKSKEWLDIAKNASSKGDGFKVGVLTITSKVINTSGQSGPKPTEAGYDVKVKLEGNPNGATFQIGTNGEISETKGPVGEINNAVKAHNKTLEASPAPTRKTGQTEMLYVDGVITDKEIKFLEKCFAQQGFSNFMNSQGFAPGADGRLTETKKIEGKTLKISLDNNIPSKLTVSIDDGKTTDAKYIKVAEKRINDLLELYIQSHSAAPQK